VTLLLLLAAQAAEVAPQREPTPAFRLYADCVVKGAISLIPSGETAETIVTAAEPACERLFPPVLAEHEAGMRRNPVLSEYSAKFGFDFEKDAAEAATGYRKAAHSLGVRYVVIEKARRATKK
jgi:hypothetical protein